MGCFCSNKVAPDVRRRPDALANTSDDSSFSDSSSVSRYRRHRTRNLRHRTHTRGQSTLNRVRHNLEEVETISEYTH